MKMIEITIKKMENEAVLKTAEVDDPENAGQKKIISYETYGWQEKTSKCLRGIPETPHNLQVISQLSQDIQSILNGIKNNNIRYQIETQLVDDPTTTAENKDVDMWFVCPNCNEVEFDITAKQIMNGSILEYRCSICDTLLATLTT